MDKPLYLNLKEKVALYHLLVWWDDEANDSIQMSEAIDFDTD